MRKRNWKRVLAGVLAATVAVTSIPHMKVAAVGSTNNMAELKDYDYNKLYSLSRNNKLLSNFNNQTQELEKGSSEYLIGEIAFIEYSLGCNSSVKIELYKKTFMPDFITGNPEGGTEVPICIGTLYGAEFTGNRKKVDNEYISNKLSIKTIKEELKKIAQNKDNFKELVYVDGASLTGEFLAYGSLEQFYSTYNLYTTLQLLS